MQNTKIGFSANLAQIKAVFKAEETKLVNSSESRLRWIGHNLPQLESLMGALPKGEKFSLERGAGLKDTDKFVPSVEKLNEWCNLPAEGFTGSRAKERLPDGSWTERIIGRTNPNNTNALQLKSMLEEYKVPNSGHIEA